MRAYLSRSLSGILGILLLFFTLSLVGVGCSPEEEPEAGPAERLGQQLDKGILGAVEKAQEAGDTLGKKFDELGDSMKESMQDNE